MAREALRRLLVLTIPLKALRDLNVYLSVTADVDEHLVG
jgi:hypothetical protein